MKATALPTPHRLTAEDLPYTGPKEEWCELVAGEIVREPPPGATHGGIAASVLILLGPFVRERGLGRLFAETGFVLARGPDTVRAPDAAFVSAERLATTVWRGPYFEGAPDLAVEVLSPGNTTGEIDDKIREYFAAGSRQVWIVDPRHETVTVHRPGRPPEPLSRSDTWDGGSLLPGFRLPVAEIFSQ